MHHLLSIYVPSVLVDLEEEGHLGATVVLGEGAAVLDQELFQPFLLGGGFDGGETVHSEA